MNRLFASTSSLTATAQSIHVRQPYIRVSYRTKSTISLHSRLKNDKIPYKIVSLVDPVTALLQPPRLLRDIIASVNPKTHHVELVTADPEPVVKIIDKVEAFKFYKQKKKQLKEASKAQETKEIQMTWQVADGDFVNKLNKVRQELAKGYKVDIVFATKSGQPLPRPMIRTNRLNEAVTALEDVAEEYRARDERHGIAALHLKSRQLE
jgi:translation initiation factor IF-3